MRCFGCDTARMQRHLTPIDRLLSACDQALRTLAGSVPASRPVPAPADEAQLSPEQKREAAALMRVNHVGEICAQALYSAQALTSADPKLQRQFDEAAREEYDHLAWTRQRIDELGGRVSLLNPAWYAGAFAIGLVAGRFGDGASLGFLVETERQVESHLAGHLEKLPIEDRRSRGIVEVMAADEARHAQNALDAGGLTLPLPARLAMKVAAKVMTATAHVI